MFVLWLFVFFLGCLLIVIRYFWSCCCYYCDFLICWLKSKEFVFWGWLYCLLRFKEGLLLYLNCWNGFLVSWIFLILVLLDVIVVEIGCFVESDYFVYCFCFFIYISFLGFVRRFWIVVFFIVVFYVEDFLFLMLVIILFFGSFISFFFKGVRKLIIWFLL